MISFAVDNDICPGVAQTIECSGRQCINSNLKERVCVNCSVVYALAFFACKSLLDIVIHFFNFVLVSEVFCNI